MNDNFTIYTKQNCKFCVQAKQLLNYRNLFYIEQEIGVHIIREHFLELFPDAKTVPVICHNGTRIGGYDDLVEYLKSYTPENILLG